MSLADIDVDDVVERYRALAETIAAGAGIPMPPGLPPREFRRSPAAATVGRLAKDAGLRCFHFEHRVHLPLPEAWMPAHDPSLAEPPEWDAGILPERKYQSFRHDLAIGSFHPHHRAKWSTHELTHGLVGFAWRADANPLFHAIAGQLAELLPVVLWYHLDEVFLRRCPEHLGGGALFRTFCPDCEAVAIADPDLPGAAEQIRAALRYLDRELAAVSRARRLGRPVSHRYATLDLSSDGVAYANAHGARLASPAFARWIEQFAVAEGGYSPDLDALEARVVAVAKGLLGAADPAPLAPTAAHGQLRWTLQDLGWRLLQIRSETDGDAASGLDRIVDALASLVGPTTRPAALDAQVVRGLQRAADAYGELCERFDLPHPGDVFALGYPYPCSAPDPVPQLVDGVKSCCPLLTDAAEDGLYDLVSAFATTDPNRRSHLARRVADWTAATGGRALASLTRWEAEVATLPRAAASLPHGPAAPGPWRLTEGFTAVVFDHDVLRLAERIDAGEVRLDDRDLVTFDGRPIEREVQALVLGREPTGEVLLLDVDPVTARILASGPFAPDALHDDELQALAELGAVRPVAWALTSG